MTRLTPGADASIISGAESGGIVNRLPTIRLASSVPKPWYGRA